MVSNFFWIPVGLMATLVFVVLKKIISGRSRSRTGLPETSRLQGSWVRPAHRCVFHDRRAELREYVRRAEALPVWERLKRNLPVTPWVVPKQRQKDTETEAIKKKNIISGQRNRKQAPLVDRRNLGGTWAVPKPPTSGDRKPRRTPDQHPASWEILDHRNDPDWIKLEEMDIQLEQLWRNPPLRYRIKKKTRTDIKSQQEEDIVQRAAAPPSRPGAPRSKSPGGGAVAAGDGSTLQGHPHTLPGSQTRRFLTNIGRPSKQRAVPQEHRTLQHAGLSGPAQTSVSQPSPRPPGQQAMGDNQPFPTLSRAEEPPGRRSGGGKMTRRGAVKKSRQQQDVLQRAPAPSPPSQPGGPMSKEAVRPTVQPAGPSGPPQNSIAQGGAVPRRGAKRKYQQSQDILQRAPAPPSSSWPGPPRLKSARGGAVANLGGPSHQAMPLDHRTLKQAGPSGPAHSSVAQPSLQLPGQQAVWGSQPSSTTRRAKGSPGRGTQGGTATRRAPKRKMSEARL